MSKRKQEWREFRRDPFVKWIKSLPCVAASDGLCFGPTDPNHQPTVGSQGKVHRRIFPLCRLHHIRLGHTGVISFQRAYGLDFERIMDDLEERYVSEKYGLAVG